MIVVVVWQEESGEICASQSVSPHHFGTLNRFDRQSAYGYDEVLIAVGHRRVFTSGTGPSNRIRYTWHVIQNRHFMWGYQPHFRISQECTAQKVFQLLDERFDPEVFLVGILVDGRQDRFPACVEPEEDFWAASELFNTALTFADDIGKEYSERNIMHSHPLVQEGNEDRLWRRSVRDAIGQIINATSQRPPELSYFVSHPAKVEGYLVSVVLGLQTAVLDQHPRLQRGSVPLHQYRDIVVPVSLIDAATIAYLEKASQELRLPDPGCDLSSLSAEEILRDGVNRLMTGLAYRADQQCLGWSQFLASCTSMACDFYEGAAGAGAMILAREHHPGVRTVVEFGNPTKLKTTRAARKLLELASEDVMLHTNSSVIYGLVRASVCDESQEDLFRIRFLGHHHWEVTHGERILARVRYGQPYLPKAPFDESKLRRDIVRIFSKVTRRQADRIVSLVHEAVREKHGTMLVISSGAKHESERLATQSTPIKPKTLTPELLRKVTPIDGAVLLNPKGTCYAVGVIVDGMSTDQGSSARGARYNSAIRYITSSRYPCLAVVVSEDGGVDFVPDLVPAIRQSRIDAIIKELADLLASGNIGRRRYNAALGWLKDHKFYLLPGHCRQINELIQLIEQRLQSEDPSDFKVVTEEFTPAPGMDPNRYYEPE